MSAGTGAVPAATALLDAALGALADPLRRRTVELLAAGPRRAGELSSALGVSAPTMSKHLRVLRQGGLVTDTAPSFDTRVRIYQLRREPLAGLHRWLADTERAWSDQLEAFAAHVGANREP
ncbi:MAG: metalloregulator ArsR/SmtB family transcription factor [Actinomycetota bacterium]|nr:metalloregulator ArsR/SmtB family transcription factor [Actinomycetota bacterium]